MLESDPDNRINFSELKSALSHLKSSKPNESKFIQRLKLKDPIWILNHVDDIPEKDLMKVLKLNANYVDMSVFPI